MKKSLAFLAISSMWALTACSEGSSGNVYTELKDSLSANAKATSSAEWHMNESNPEKVFVRWNEELIANEVTSQEVCDSLRQLSDEELPLFEEEINAKQNVALVGDCKEDLKARLDSHFKAERANLTANIENFDVQLNSVRFADAVQYRDTSKGYFAFAGDVGPKQVVLTFDDGPSGEYTPSILKTLEKANVKAIFFELGKAVKANPELSKAVANAGHSLGAHSMTHSCLGNKMNCKKQNGGHLFSTQEAWAEIVGSLTMIRNTVGWVDPFFRFPYGESSPELKRALAAKGIGEFLWNIDSNDWQTKSPKAVIDDTMAQIKARGKGIVLFHDIHRRTAEALPEFLRQLYNGGYQPVLLKPKNGVMTGTLK